MSPQIIYLVLAFTSLMINANKHGKMSEKPTNVWLAITAFSVQISLLYWGGFFDSILK